MLLWCRWCSLHIERNPARRSTRPRMCFVCFALLFVSRLLSRCRRRGMSFILTRVDRGLEKYNSYDMCHHLVFHPSIHPSPGSLVLITLSLLSSLVLARSAATTTLYVPPSPNINHQHSLAGLPVRFFFHLPKVVDPRPK